MSSDPPELGKGLFGYRKSVVNQIIADRDIMLRQAEGRVRAAESKVAELESEIRGAKEKTSRMEEQLERLRAQFDTLMTRGEPEAGKPESPRHEPAHDDLPDAPASVAEGEEEPEEPAMPGPIDVFADLEPADEPEVLAGYVEDSEEYLYRPTDFTYGAEPQAEAQDEPPATEDEPQDAPPPMPSADMQPPKEDLEMQTAAPEPSLAPEAREPAPQASTLTERFLTQDLAGILRAAEESAARIVERAQESTERQIRESNRLWQEVQSELSRFASWREHVDPLIHGIQSRVQEVRASVEDVPERIRQALAPMADAISSLDADLGDLGSAWNPPLLLTPSSLEAEGEGENDTPSEQSSGWDDPPPAFLYDAGPGESRFEAG